MAEVGWEELRVEVQGRPVFIRRLFKAAPAAPLPALGPMPGAERRTGRAA